VEFCHTHGIRVAEGCPYMFLEASGFPHRVHGFLLRLAGHYPAKAA
jgi:hypothetical protein